MSDQRMQDLCDVVRDSLEKLAFLFASADSPREPIPFQDAMTAIASFSGAFSGYLAVSITPPALTELAANMLGIESDEIEEEHQQDALKEAVNIICGNWLPVEGGDEAIFHIDAPQFLSPSEAETALTGRKLSILAQMTVEDEPCDIYFYRDDPV